MNKIDKHFTRLMLDSLKVEQADGGEGSGNFNHAGRPGEVGGSAPAEGGASGATAEQPSLNPPQTAVKALREAHAQLRAKPSLSGARAVLRQSGAFRKSAVINLAGCDKRVAPSFIKAYANILESYPFMYGQFGSLRTNNSFGEHSAYKATGQHVYAHCVGMSWNGKITNEIVLNVSGEGMFEDGHALNFSYVQDVKSRYHPQGTDDDAATAILTHECGHAVCNSIAKAAGMKPEELAAEIQRRALEASLVSPANIPYYLSEYATKDAEEFFAEAFCEYVCNGERGTRGLAMSFKKQLDLFLKTDKRGQRALRKLNKGAGIDG